MMRPQYTSEKLERDLLRIEDTVLAERLARVTPLILRNNNLFTFDIPDLHNEIYLNATGLKLPVGPPNLYEEVTRTATHHRSETIAIFKPSIAEVLAQLPNDPNITAFYLDTASVVVLGERNGHLCTCHWLTDIPRDKRV